MWIHQLWHSVYILRQRREALPPDQLIDIDIDNDTRDVIYEAHNNNIYTVSQCLGFPFDMDYALHKMYANTSIVDVSLPSPCFDSRSHNGTLNWNSLDNSVKMFHVMIVRVVLGI